LRPVVGGLVIVGLTLVFSWREFGGLSIELATEAMGGGDVASWIPKLLLTAVAIGSGFVGGEVIPLVVIGTLLGGATGDIIGLDVSLASQTGAVALLGAAGNVPLACITMGLELFGSASAVMVALPCVVAYVASGHSGIYHAQVIASHKSGPA
jgi:H+/Cl- antiporter ClcA